MRFISFLFLTLFALTTHAALPEYTLMVYGDSLSAGYRLPANESYANQLQDTLKKAGYVNVRVTNFSKSGETTSGGLTRQQTALNQAPNAVILELGINDALQGIDLSTTQKNLKNLIEKFQTQNIPVILIGMQAPPTRDAVYRQNFNRMYQDLAKEYNLYFYPFFMKDVLKINLRQMTFDTTLLQSDGAHPTAKGVSIMVENTLPTVIAFFKNQGIQK